MDIFNPIIHLIESSGGLDEAPPLQKGTVFKAKVLDSPVSGQVRFKVGPRLIQAVLSQYIEPGREVRIQVKETAPRLVLTILNEEETPPKAEHEPVRVSKAPVPARSDRPVITARILAPPRGDKVRLRIIVPPPALRKAPPSPLRQAPLLARGRELTARLVGPELIKNIRTGREIRFEVAKTFPSLVLRAARGPAEAAPKTASLGPALIQNVTAYLARPDQAPKEAAALLAGLGKLMVHLPPEVQAHAGQLIEILRVLSPAPAADREFLPRLTRAFGLAGPRERLPEAVARFLSEVAAAFERDALKESPELSRVLEAAGRLFEGLDRLAAVNQEIWPRDNMVHFSFPLFWPDGGGRGEMSLRLPPAEGDGGGEPVRVSFLLDLSRVGRIRIDAEIFGKKVRGTFFAEREAVRLAVDRSLPQLTGALEAHGIQATEWSVKVFPPERRPPVSLVEDHLPRRDGLIDVEV